MSTIYGYDYVSDTWKPLKAVQLADGTWVLKVDTEIDLDTAEVNISNIKVGSPNQSKDNLRWLKVMDDGTVVTAPNPTELYKTSDVDDGHNVNYYGYTDVDGGWFILKEDLSVSPNTYRYVKGDINYANNWTNRASLTYDYFFNTF